MTKKNIRVCLCPSCEQVVVRDRITKFEKFTSQGTSIIVTGYCWRCCGCNAEWTDSTEPDELDYLYKEFKVRTGKKWVGHGSSMELLFEKVN